MKKAFIISWLILAISNFFLLDKIFASTGYVSELSVEVNNPVSLKDGTIYIATAVQDASIRIMFWPYVLAGVISATILIVALRKKNRVK